VEGWKRVDLAFAPGTASLLTPVSQWRAGYGLAAGAGVIALAGYAGTSGSQEAESGIGRLTVLVDALAPEVEPAAGVRPDFVTGPPAELLLPGTDGSAFLVTHDPVPHDPDELAAFAIELGAEDDPLGSAIRGGQPAEVPDADPAIDALGTRGVGSTDLSGIALEARQSLVNRDLGPDRLVQVVEWTHTSLDDGARAALHALAEQVTAVLAAQPELAELTVEPPLQVGFGRTGGGPAARLYVLITPLHDVVG
jgi:hypothetical protein